MLCAEFFSCLLASLPPGQTWCVEKNLIKVRGECVYALYSSEKGVPSSRAHDHELTHQGRSYPVGRLSHRTRSTVDKRKAKFLALASTTSLPSMQCGRSTPRPMGLAP